MEFLDDECEDVIDGIMDRNDYERKDIIVGRMEGLVDEAVYIMYNDKYNLV